jgi:hypothetical protein
VEIGWSPWGMLPHSLPQQAPRESMPEYPEGMTHVGEPGDSVAIRRRAAAEQMRGMFAHVAPGLRLADELIADRRAEVSAEGDAE